MSCPMQGEWDNNCRVLWGGGWHQVSSPIPSSVVFNGRMGGSLSVVSYGIVCGLSIVVSYVLDGGSLSVESYGRLGGPSIVVSCVLEGGSLSVIFYMMVGGPSIVVSYVMDGRPSSLMSYGRLVRVGGSSGSVSFS